MSVILSMQINWNLSTMYISATFYSFKPFSNTFYEQRRTTAVCNTLRQFIEKLKRMKTRQERQLVDSCVTRRHISTTHLPTLMQTIFFLQYLVVIFHICFFFSNLRHVNLRLSYSIIDLDLFGNLVVYKDSASSW